LARFAVNGGYRMGQDYGLWIACNDTVGRSDASKMRAIISAWPDRPRVSIIMPVCDTTEAFLVAAIRSVLRQTYEDWELCIADDASTSPWIRPLLHRYAAQDPRIRVCCRTERGGIAAASNSALAMATGAWIGLLDHDDALVPHALFCVMDAVRGNPGVELLYSDEDKIDLHGRRFDPYFKPPLNLELLRSQHYISHFTVLRESLLRQLGGFREGLDGAQDHDLVLRAIDAIQARSVVHIPHVLYHWRVHAKSTAGGLAAKPQSMQAGLRAVADHLRRRGLRGGVDATPFGYRVRLEPIGALELVSIVIPTRNRHEVLRKCVESVLSSIGDVPTEIIVMDNGSDEPSTLEYLAEIAKQPNVRVIRDEGPFNYSRLNNRAVDMACGRYVVLLNNDTEVISPDWLKTMLGIMSQSDVGAVGAKLLYPDDTVQFGGTVIGIGGVAGHVHTRRSRSDPGYFCRAQLQQEFGAVTGACMMVRKEDFLAVGGLDETHLAVAFNDVDLCLKLGCIGKRIVWSPFVELFHHESLSRGLEDTPEKRARFEAEVRHMLSRWSNVLAKGDPAYNPNLCLTDGDFLLARCPRVVKPWRLVADSPEPRPCSDRGPGRSSD
jgi:GT2 family glycosyltransferase